MALDRAAADPESEGDLLVCSAFNDTRKDLSFPYRQALEILSAETNPNVRQQ